MGLTEDQRFLNLAFYACYNAGVMNPDDSASDATGAPNEMVKLDVLHKRANQILLKCRTVFPFDLFPNSLIIDHNKVDIIYRNFYRTDHTVSIPIERINYVSVDSVFFLSTLRIDVKGWDQNPRPLVFLKTREAHLAKNLIFGLMNAHTNRIDLSELPKGEVIETLVDIGRSV